MVTIKDGCGCGTASCCSWKDKLEEAYKRATASVNKIGDDAGNVYFPDGTGYVKVPLPTRAQVAQIQTNADDITTLKQRATASEGDIDTLEQDVVRIDTKDTTQDQSIKDNSDRITSTNNDLIATEATVATHDSDIITLKANNQALAKSLVSDVLMADGTTAGSVQVSIKREDGALITSANYKWGRDIGVRLEAGTQAGYIKTVISLSDGTELVSNEYKIVEVLESDVYVTAITLVPDMTAGTIGGNISYSNGTTQTINAVNVPTAPGVTSAIEALQTRMAAVEQKNTTQDSQISAIDARVKAIEDTPGVGQFGAGKLGTIAGSAADGRVKAEDDGTGSVNGWSALKQRVTTAEGQIVAAQNDISGLMTDVTNLGTSKVNVAQGTENAGKALIVGENGNVIPALISAGGIEKIDLNNWPTDWAEGDVIFITLHCYIKSTATSWEDTTRNVLSINNNDFNPWPFGRGAFSWIAGGTSNTYLTFPIESVSHAKAFISIVFPGLTAFNRTSTTLCYISANGFNGANGSLSASGGDIEITSPSQLANYVTSIYRIKAS